MAVEFDANAYFLLRPRSVSCVECSGVGTERSLRGAATATSRSGSRLLASPRSGGRAPVRARRRSSPDRADALHRAGGRMQVRPKAVVLLSGGLDSTTTLAVVKSEG